MALRLNKKDVVSKSSYYVWFLGAEEARGLRGGRVLLPVIPYLVERSREIEPIKVTLQVSSKGMKIIQVWSPCTAAINQSFNVFSFSQRNIFKKCLGRFFSYALPIILGLIEAFHRSKLDNELRSSRRHCGLRSDAV